jgi:hypothetical protein
MTTAAQSREWRARNAKQVSTQPATTTSPFGQKYTCAGCGRPVFEKFVDIDKSGSKHRSYWHRYCNPARAGVGLAVESLFGRVA